MLQRKNGATPAEIMAKMGWQRHTVRGFMAGAMKKAGYTVESFKPEGGERTYRLPSEIALARSPSARPAPAAAGFFASGTSHRVVGQYRQPPPDARTWANRGRDGGHSTGELENG